MTEFLTTTLNAAALLASTSLMDAPSTSTCERPLEDLNNGPNMSLVIPTYRREHVLVETLDQLLPLRSTADEILVIDQTERHEPATELQLNKLHADGSIRWIRQSPASITAAMNRGLLEAHGEVVLFLDDDVKASPSLLSAHRQTHANSPGVLVAGRVIQPWQRGEASTRASDSGFASREPAWATEFMGGNFSIRRDVALALGGFDENFVQAAYRFEAEFAHRFRAAGGRIRFEPQASLHHLQEPRGGTRSYGSHLTTARPAHAVGAYYFALRTQSLGWFVRECVTRPLRAVTTRHHLRAPWWIAVTLLSELRGICLAVRLHRSGPRLIKV